MDDPQYLDFLRRIVEEGDNLTVDDLTRAIEAIEAYQKYKAIRWQLGIDKAEA